MTRKSQHVVPRQGKWAVRSTGSKKAASIHDTQQEAIARARQRAKDQKTELFIHGRDGQVRDRNSYGHDPARRKG